MLTELVTLVLGLLEIYLWLNSNGSFFGQYTLATAILYCCISCYLMIVT